jgi:TRAP-type C4-dicarboxylate transport system permease small subunit
MSTGPERDAAMAVSPFSRTLDILVWAITTICCVLLVWLIVITGIQVFGRYVLNDSPVWVERTALLTVLYIALPMAAVGIRQRFHMNVTIAVDALGPTGREVASILVDLGLGLFGAAMAWHGGVIAHRVWSSKMAVLPLPEGVNYLPLVICGVLIVLFSIERLVGAPHRLRRAAILPYE